MRKYLPLIPVGVLAGFGFMAGARQLYRDLTDAGMATAPAVAVTGVYLVLVTGVFVLGMRLRRRNQTRR